MLNFLVSWAEQLIIALVIIIMVEMIIPNSSYRKYIKVILGIFIIYTIFSPLIGNKLNSIDFSKSLSYQEKEIKNSTNQVKINYDKQIENTYKEKFKESLTEELKEKGYEIEKFETEVKYENNDIKTEKLKISIKKFNKDKQTKVEKVTITDESKIQPEEIEKLKQEIGSNYNIEISKISITESEK